jgi:hypothetical protein
MSTSRQSKPSVHIKNKLGLAAVRQAVKEWVELDPNEVAKWRAYQKALSELHEWTGGWSESRELLAAGYAPSFVIFRTARLLSQAGWDTDEARFWDVTQEGGKNAPSSLWKAAVKELLPEMQTTRKERVQRFHHGVSLPSVN